MNAPARITAAQEHPLGPAFDLIEQRSSQFGHAKSLLQSLVIAASLPANLRESSMLSIAQQAEDALKGALS